MHAVEPYCSTCVFHVTSLARETCALRGWRESQERSVESGDVHVRRTHSHTVLECGVNSHASLCGSMMHVPQE